MDYAKLSKTATRLITANGIIIRLVKFASGTDIAKPWVGSSPASVASYLDKPAVIVSGSSGSGGGSVTNNSMGSKEILDDFLKRFSYVAIIACDGDDLMGNDAIVKDGVTYRILAQQQLKPATIPLIGYVGFNQ